MSLSMGTNGIRGLLSELGAAEALDLGFGFGTWCKENFPSPKTPPRFRVAVARDMRLTSPMLSQAAMAGIMESGCDAIDIGLLPSPVAEWASGHLDCDGLIVITASHNSAEWNALKFVDAGGVAVSKERGAGICAFLGKKRSALGWKNTGRQEKNGNITAEYRQAVLAFIDRSLVSKKKNWKIIFDPGNGTSTLVAPQILRSLGAEVIVINEKLDGTFPGRPSEPTEKNVAGLIAAVKKEKADFGFACDGDSDRVVFVDGKGRWMVGDKCFALHAQWALSKIKNAGSPASKSTGAPVVVTTVATSKVVQDVASKFGARVHYTKVGAPYLSEAMLSENAVSGGEEVGGIIWPGFSLAKDGILAAAITLEMAAQKPLSDWHDELPKYYNAKTKIGCTPQQKQKISELAKKIKAESKNAIVNGIDGVRIDFPDSWVIIRASGTENYFRVFAEAKTEKGAESLMNEYAQKVSRLLK